MPEEGSSMKQRKLYRIERIEEPDFGCEGRPDGQPMMDKVYLCAENQQELVVEAADQWMYQMDLNEGDTVFYSEEAGLEKYEK